MRTTLLTTILLSFALMQTACDVGDTPAFGDGSTTVSTTGVPAIENFRVDLTEGYVMTIFDANTQGVYDPSQDNGLVISAYDHNGAPVSNLTVNFAVEWGVLPDGTSCVTDSTGVCSIAWKISDPGTAPNDLCVRIVAYSTGEESFYDSNGNNTFDDSDTVFAGVPSPFVNGFIDLPDPYYDTDRSGSYTFGVDIPVPGFDSHTPADGLYNGSQTCTTTNFCSTTNTITIWDDVYIDLKDESTITPATVPPTLNTCLPFPPPP